MPKSSADTVIDLYQRNATAWLALRGVDLVERDWLDRFLAAMPPDMRQVLDLGCGSGRPIAEYLIGHGCRITGVDGAPAMIDVARTTFPEHGWIAADMRKLPPLGRFHGLIAWHSLFHLKPEDQRPMFEAFRHHSHPGAALLFTSGTTQGEAIGTFAGRPLYHGSLDSDEYRRLLHSNGFDVIRHIEDDPECGGATIWLAKKVLGAGSHYEMPSPSPPPA